LAKTLAEIALDEGLVDREALAAAARRADERDEPLVVSLIRGAGVGEVALVGAIRRQMRAPMTDPMSLRLDSDALRELPREVCQRRRVLPIGLAVHSQGPREMTLAMADPTDQVAIAEVEHLTGCRVLPTVMTLSAIEELVDSGYRGFVTKVMRRERPPSYAEAPSANPQFPDVSARPRTQPVTAPHRRVAAEPARADELAALISLLIDKGVITAEDFERALAAAQGRDPEG
jgi:type IV pilus assembly protein PilB